MDNTMELARINSNFKSIPKFREKISILVKRCLKSNDNINNEDY